MVRSRTLLPSAMIRDNLVFVAKAPEPESVRFLADKSKLPVDPKTLIANDIFVVAFTLVIRELTVLSSGADVEDVCIEFEHDDNYNLLEACDAMFIDQIASYVALCFVDELQRSGSETLAEEVPFHEVSTCDSTLEMSDCKDSFYDMADLALLESNDTAIEGRRPRSSIHDDFITDINNLRHNAEYSIEDQDNDTEHDIDFGNSPQTIQISDSADEVLHHLDEITFSMQEQTKEFDNELRLPIKLKSSRPELRQPQAEPQIEVLLRKNSLSSIQAKSPAVKKSSSFTISMDDFDSDKFAPIKGDKKFKYIKVGKVQKFVNLFEEKVQEEDILSRPTSPKKDTRAHSPSIKARDNGAVGFKGLHGAKDSIKI